MKIREGRGVQGTRSLLLITLLASAFNGEANSWSRVERPSPGPSQAIGSTSAGCLQGADRLPLEGEGYVVMHLERDRYYGHPKLIESIKSLGRRAAETLGVMHVGDLGMARGGPMPFGHRSHQTGLDADIWFDLSPALHLGSNALRSDIKAPSFLNPLTRELDERLWSDRQARMLKSTAQLPEVDRIFVNAQIKRELCRSTSGDRSWLHKIRPWYYHEDHFHMRLACPPDSPACVRQKPIPAGDGCDATLEWWLDHNPATSSRSTTAARPPEPVMPTECRSLLSKE